MRNLLLLLSALICLGYLRGCFRADAAPAAGPGAPVAGTVGKYPQPIVLLIDATRSDTFIQPDTASLAALLRRFRERGAELTGIAVLPDSYAQQTFYCRIAPMDTLPYSGNFILNRRNRIENRRRVQAAERLLKAAMEDVRHWIEQCGAHDTSDVQNALRLVEMTARAPAGAGREPLVILAGDLRQDRIHGIAESLAPVRLPSGIRLVIVGHHPETDLETLFPGQSPIELPSFKHLSTL